MAWKIMTMLRLIAYAVLTLAILLQSASAEDDAGNILARADEIRFPRDPFQVNVKITTSSAEKQASVEQYQILCKGNERTTVITTAPAAERGQILLMRDQDLWFFTPKVSQAIRLPLSQRLTGQVSYGDLARSNFSGDYTPKLLRDETIENNQYHVLELTAKDRSVTYHRVLYWINASDFRPYKAEFYTISGRHLKTCWYQTFSQVVGALRPTTLIMEDALKGEKSVLEYSGFLLRDLPEKYFTKDYLKKLY
jgi:outer membrane lipoprotein-sorting protein